jgi:hypothetical protein
MTENNEAREGLFTSGRDVSFVEMGRDDVLLSCTQGKITLWLGRQASEDLVWQIISGISKVDSSVVHEQEVVCGFDAISKHEGKGYILSSYAKTRGGYRAIFTIPFSKKNALKYFVKSIIEELKETDVRKVFHWDGSLARIMLIFNEFKRLENWEIKRIEYKDETMQQKF